MELRRFQKRIIPTKPKRPLTLLGTIVNVKSGEWDHREHIEELYTSYLNNGIEGVASMSGIEKEMKLLRELDEMEAIIADARAGKDRKRGLVDYVEAQSSSEDDNARLRKKRRRSSTGGESRGKSDSGSSGSRKSDAGNFGSRGGRNQIETDGQHTEFTFGETSKSFGPRAVPAPSSSDHLSKKGGFKKMGYGFKTGRGGGNGGGGHGGGGRGGKRGR